MDVQGRRGFAVRSENVVQYYRFRYRNGSALSQLASGIRHRPVLPGKRYPCRHARSVPESDKLQFLLPHPAILAQSHAPRAALALNGGAPEMRQSNRMQIAATALRAAVPHRN